MRLWYLATALVAGCGFQHGIVADAQHDAAVADTAQMEDAALPDAATPDAMPDAARPTDDDQDGVPDTTDNCPADANPDQRDHDGDTHGDACDRCPHLASETDPDGDADGVGDECDPRPSMPGDSIALFEGFYDANSIASWTANGGMWTVANGVLTQASTAATDVQLIAPVNVVRGAVTSQAHVIALGTPSPGNGFTYPHVSVTAGVATGQAYWCSVLDDPQDGDKIYATYDYNGTPTQFPSAAWPGTFGAGSDVQVTVALLGGNSVCTVKQGATTASVNGNLGATSGAVQVATRTASASFDYLFAVSIGN